MKHVAVCIIWHMHQPYYPDDVTGECRLPWVRLHAIKDYYGMALLARRFPRLRVTFNLVPSLLEQLQRYADGRLVDRFQALTAKPAAQLTEEERQEVLAGFFMADQTTMINPHVRYRHLFGKRQGARRGERYETSRFRTQDFRDLQCWFNLVWFHPLCLERWPEIGELIRKGRGFSEQEKQRILELQREVVAAVIPLYKELQDKGQAELTTSPYFHPILPILVDRSCARIAMPQAPITGMERRYVEDAATQLQEAVQAYRETFGRPPRGLWPSEGSVSRDIVPLCRDAGFQWLATDEDILAHSLGQPIERDLDRELVQPEALYQPYRYVGPGGPMDVLFRDHYLSDLIGFQYQKASAESAVRDLMTRIRSAGRCRLERTPLVTIILDGENAWEYYPNQGVDFLSQLYQELTTAEDITTVTPSAYLEREPPEMTLDTLFPGSWINHNFAIWIGHDEDNQAWSYLDRTREFLVNELAEHREELPSDRVERAWRELYIAQGSDWFWWYGDDHVSGMDDLYDGLFRKHLKNVYLFMGQEAPVFLETAIARTATKPVYDEPKQFLEVSLDGRSTNYFEWLGAGHYRAGGSRGAMAGSRGPVKDIYFGFNERLFLLRIDCHKQARTALGRFQAVRVLFGGARELAIEVTQCGRASPVVTLREGEGPPSALPGATAACGAIFELAVPFHDLGLVPRAEVQFVVEFVEREGVVSRHPRESSISFRVPTAEFERRMWTA